MNLEENEFIFITREKSDLPGARYRAYNFSRFLNSQGIKSQVLSYADTLGALSGELEKFLTFKDKIALNIKAFSFLKNYHHPIFIIQRFNYHAIAPYLYSRLKKVRFIFDLDDWEFREDTGYIFGFFPKSKAEFLCRIVARDAQICLAGSKFLENYLKNINSNTYYLPPGIDLNIYQPSARKVCHPVNIGWVGTMFRQEDFYNLNLLFTIVSKMDCPFHLKIIGSGIYINEVKHLVEKLKIENISFTGWIKPDAVPIILDEIDIGVYPVAVRNKFMNAKFPVKILEFMAKGIPVVATNFGEVTYIINHGQEGFLVDNPEDFQEALYTLINDSNLRKEMGNRCRAKIEKEYSLNIQGKKLLNILRNV